MSDVYVVLCRAEKIYDGIKQLYGSSACSLLRINSLLPGSQRDDQIPEPWSQYMARCPRLQLQVQSSLWDDFWYRWWWVASAAVGDACGSFCHVTKSAAFGTVGRFEVWEVIEVLTCTFVNR